MLTDATQLLETMGWISTQKRDLPKAKELFISLTPEEKVIVDLLHEKAMVSIDEINLQSGLNSSTVAVSILNLELKNVVQGMPGKMYKLY
ncbi:DprA-like winged helix domain-containing protein [Niabella hibiscisoli]|uniref:DprA-like winged helix domain-containing protein n=1 Tax=Niabella hibiscisoli TaxID=1825928 RepID=UPI001F0D8697|nr:hypothetical protein [Niabella hibiscisoli]MCH5715874.1 hypothetical protein [Niabella hibiscisoli]